ncbi:hypothetical protein B0J13DRAFT_576548 [Dactylonectria estremocensis]|uniref:DUF3533 domain-containing protein n=1 Tax=Dactylonectria estremocensis TaxID=1079267 RepID=A0A9P9D337_9HYPO|nr:hypothetical protein B0J13DRAFT_576548 [Dactylonectria estremocensis]
MSIIPARSHNRQPASSAFWNGRWRLYMLPIMLSGFLLQMLFLGNMSYLYGALFKSGTRTHNLKVLAIDFDGGEIGQAVSGAYSALEGKDFPTVEFGSSSQYPTPDSLHEAVCKHGYWGAVYTHSGASDRLLATIEGDNTTAYNASDAVTYIYNGIYYPAVVASIRGNLQTLVSAASRVYYRTAPDAAAAVNMTNPASASAYLNPIEATAFDLMPTNHGTRVLLNTVSMVMPILMQFFFIMALNGVMGAAGVLEKQSKRDVYVFRLCVSKLHTFICSLCMAGYIWAFREDWGVTAGQFFETWMCLWFYMEINYLVLDAVVGTIIPMSFFSYFMLTWVILNIGSTLYPFELSPGFYRWGWALPAHNIWLVLVDIWSNGCRQQLDVTMPILFAWWIVGHFVSAWSVQKRCLMAEAEAQHEKLNDDKYPRASTNQSQRFVLDRLSSRASGHSVNDGRVDDHDLEANRVGDRLPDASDSRAVVSTAVSSQENDAAKLQKE